jgi:hypothetical protein
VSRIVAFPRIRVATIVLSLCSLVTIGLFVSKADAAQPAGLDHFVCYTSSATTTSFPQRAKAVMLKNQFAPNGFLAATSLLNQHCNPATKFVGETKFSPQNPQAHLACFALNPNTQPRPVNVIVENQFGKADLVTGNVRSLCLPTWKNPQEPNFPEPIQPANLDHFTCYDVRYRDATRFQRPQVRVEDQFGGTSPVQPGGPRTLCVPTRKYTDPAVAPPAFIHPRAHLLCFAFAPPTPVPLPQRVFDKNQFGIGDVTAKVTATLCLPSFKTIDTAGT